jgi:CRP-like cAMP-binding protein
MAAKRVRALPPVNRPPPSSGPAIQNLLLAALPVDAYERVAQRLEVIPLKLKRVVHNPGDPIEHVYFPGGGFLSVLTVLEDGCMVEVATIGREGMTGVSAALDGSGPRSVVMVQAEMATCYRLAIDDFRREMDRNGAFFSFVTRYSQAFIGMIMQSTACNAVHSVEQRLARWLLMAHDRVGKNEFPLTQEFVAMMLGVARPTVSIVAGTLQSAGLIKYRRGNVTIVDREELESASCECYRAAADLLRGVSVR